MVTEIWKPIAGYEELYEVSNTGKVRSKFRYKKELHLSPNKATGYVYAQLFKNRKGRNFAVHRLVATAFCENPQNKPFVNHLDEIKTNNNADNLEWVTHKENCNYGTAIERRVAHTNYSKRKQNSANQIKACSKPIAQYTSDGKFICEWKSISDCCRANGWTISNIGRAIKSNKYKAYGYIFRELERSE